MWRLVREATPIGIFLALILLIHGHPGGTITTWLAAIGALSISLLLYLYTSLFG